MPLPTSTTAAILEATGEPLRLRTLELPQLRAGQVLVEIAWSGVCGSQLLEVDGGRGEDGYLPHGLGHEGSGTALATGEGVTRVAAGDRVVLTWIKGEGADVPGTVYESAEGPVNSGAVITFAHHAVVSENRVVRAPDLSLREAALLGCALPTGAGAVLNTGGAAAGDTVVVIGVGGVGLAAVIGAGLADADRIIAVDVHQPALDRARSLGATDLVDASQGDLLDALLALTEGRGGDVVVEAAGRVQTMEAGFRATRLGGVCVIAGNPVAGSRISIDPMDLIRGRRIVGSWGGDAVMSRDLPRLADALTSGRFPVGALIGGEFALSEVNDALEALRRGTPGRMMLDMGR